MSPWIVVLTVVMSYLIMAAVSVMVWHRGGDYLGWTMPIVHGLIWPIEIILVMLLGLGAVLGDLLDAIVDHWKW